MEQLLQASTGLAPEATGGTGLGLSIVKAVQDAHGNACGCDNVEGGVAFWFDVDLAENDVADGEEPA